jgi:L-fuculose-phosphate aldolase
MKKKDSQHSFAKVSTMIRMTYEAASAPNSKSPSQLFSSIQIFDPHTQYTDRDISTFEHTFGKHYSSVGGEDMTHLMAKALSPQPDCRMLDIGFGAGGAALVFAEHYDAVVEGIDLNPVGWERANEELQRRNKERARKKGLVLPPLRVHFQVTDVSHAEFENDSFDIVYSRDVLLHLDADSKQAVLAKCLQWLKPGGKICIGDYCHGRSSPEKTGLPTQDSATYLGTREYHMWTPEIYKKSLEIAGFQDDNAKDMAYWYCTMYQTELDRVTSPGPGYHMWTPEIFQKSLENAGFQDVNAKDMAYWYCTMCQTELDRIALPGPERQKLILEHGEARVAKLEETYRDKIQRTLRGDRTYALVTATKQVAHFELRQQVAAAYQKLFKIGHVMTCDGNVSARVDATHFLTTPSGIDASEVDASKIVLCHRTGNALHSSYTPTSEVDLHRLMYQARPDVGAIVHSHSIYACALACCRIPLPPAHYSVCDLLHNTSRCSGLSQPQNTVIHCSTYHTYGTRELAIAALAALGTNHACLLANHGAVIVGADMEEAMYRAERLERECEIYWRCKQLGKPICLTPEEIASLHRRDQTYGQALEPDGTSATSSTSAESWDYREECIEGSTF